MNDVTEILSRVQRGDRNAPEQLFAVLYGELKRIATYQMRRESNSHTLQPTALVNEAFVRLLGGDDGCPWENRAHFFGVAAEAMRRILIEAARAKRAQKRGGDAVRVGLNSEEPAQLDPLADEVLDLNDAIIELEQEDQELADLVKLRFFAGMSMDQIADLQQVSKSTIERRWTFAKAWLGRRLNA